MKKTLLRKIFATALLIVASTTAALANTDGTLEQYNAALSQINSASLYYLKATPDGGTTWYYMTSDLEFSTDKSEAVELKFGVKDNSSNKNLLSIDGTPVKSFLITTASGTDGLRCVQEDEGYELEWSSEGGPLWRQQVLFYDGTNFAIRATAATGGVIYWNYTEDGFSFDNQNGPLFVWQIEASDATVEETSVSYDYYTAAMNKITSGSNYYIAAIPFGTKDVHYIKAENGKGTFTDNFSDAMQFTFTVQDTDENTIKIDDKPLNAWRICPTTSSSSAFFYTQGDYELVLDDSEYLPLRHQQVLFYNGSGFAIRVAAFYLDFFWQWVADDDPELAGFEFSQNEAHYIWQISTGQITFVNGVMSVDNPTVKSIYGVNGARRSTMQHGINLVKMSDGTVKKQIVK